MKLGRRANSDEGEARSTAGDGRSEGREGRRHLRADGPAVCRVEAELSLTDRQQLDAEVRLNVLLVGIEHPPPQRVPRRCRSRQGASGTDVVEAGAGGERPAPQKKEQQVDRRQLTGKMKPTALAIGMSGTASPRRTIVLSLAKANSVILESPERDVKRPFRPKSSTVLGGNHCGTSRRYLYLFRG